MQKIFSGVSNVFNSTLTLMKNTGKIYKTNFHVKWYAPIFYGVFFLLGLIGIVFLNLHFIRDGRYSFHQINLVLNNLTEYKLHGSISKQISSVDYTYIQKGIFATFGTIIGGMGMALSAIIAQSLTKNSIAEGSTLGLVQSSIFGVIMALSFVFIGFWMKFLFALIFGIVGAVLLLIIIVLSKNKMKANSQKIILIGLAIGVIFKTLSFLFRQGDANLNRASFALVLGGAESIVDGNMALSTGDIQTTLITAASLVSGALLISIINIKGMNLLLIGEERAKNLGSSVIITKVLNVLVIVLALPAAVMVVGNMAFLGLFAIHSSRWFMRTRNHKIIIPFTLIFAMFVASIGMQLTEHIPSINSGLWSTFIGAPYLMYIGTRGLK